MKGTGIHLIHNALVKENGGCPRHIIVTGVFNHTGESDRETISLSEFHGSAWKGGEAQDSN